MKVDLSSYATKTDLKDATGIDISNFTLISNLASLKTEVNKIDVDKLKTVPVDLSELSNIVNKDVVKKAVFNKLVTKVNNIDTTEFVLKTKYDIDKSDLEKKISDAESKIPSINALVTNSAVTPVENKLPDVKNLVKKTDYNTKINEIESKRQILCAKMTSFNKKVT